MLNRSFAKGMEQKHMRARRRLRSLSPPSKSRGQESAQYTRAFNNRIAELRFREPHPLEPDFWKRKWLKATVTFLRELRRVKERAKKQLVAQSKAGPIRWSRVTSRLPANERRERAMLLQAARQDKKGQADVKTEKLDQASAATATAMIRDRDEDHPPRNDSAIPAPTIRKIEQIFTRLRLDPRLRTSFRKVPLAVRRDQRTGQRVRYHSRLRKSVGMVKYLSKSAATARRRIRRKARLSHSLSSTLVSTATTGAAHGPCRSHYAYRTNNRTLPGIRGKLVRRVRLLKIRLLRRGLYEKEISYQRLLANRRYAVSREKESLWTTMRAAATGGLPVLPPTSRRRLQAQKLMESVQEFLIPDMIAYKEGEYKPWRSEQTPDEYGKGEHEPSRGEETPDEYREGEYKPFRE